MGEKKTPLGYYNYTVILTYAGMLSAFFSILMSINGRFWDAVILLMVSGLCDMFDGAVAATKQRTDQEKRFGIQIDSLCDLVSFGVTPAVFVYMISGRQTGAAVVSAIFLLAALIRLAYFNVTEEDRQKTTSEKRSFYLGVPVTSISVVLPLVYILESTNIFRGPIPYLGLLLLSSAGFLTPIEIKKPSPAGKIALILIGVFETLGILIWGWNLA